MLRGEPESAGVGFDGELPAAWWVFDEGLKLILQGFGVIGRDEDCRVMPDFAKTGDIPQDQRALSERCFEH